MDILTDRWTDWQTRLRQVDTMTSVTRRLELICQFIWKVAKTVAKQKEMPKLLHQDTFETLKYQQQTTFWNCLFMWKCQKSESAQVNQNVTISLANFIFYNNHNELPKVAQLAKNHSIWSPWQWVGLCFWKYFGSHQFPSQVLVYLT